MGSNVESMSESSRVRRTSSYDRPTRSTCSLSASVFCVLYIFGLLSEGAAQEAAAQTTTLSDPNTGSGVSLKYPILADLGQVCGGWRGIRCLQPLECHIIFDKKYGGEAPGICRQKPDPTSGDGEPCEGLLGTKCRPGLDCTYPKNPKYDFPIDYPGVCRPTPCGCDEVAGERVCAKDLNSGESKHGKNSTYSSPCKASCSKAFILYRGRCANAFDPNIACKCTIDYKPVCATNPDTAITDTYLNACQAGCWRYPVLYEGNCTSPDSVPGQSCDCGSINEPVCGFEDEGLLNQPGRGKTFKNLCSARCSGAFFYTPGKCAGPLVASDFEQAPTPP